MIKFFCIGLGYFRYRYKELWDYIGRNDGDEVSFEGLGNLMEWVIYGEEVEFSRCIGSFFYNFVVEEDS